MPINTAAAPRIGQQVYYDGRPAGIVYKIEDTIAYTSKDGRPPQGIEAKRDADFCINGFSCFIWGFTDGTLNKRHTWKEIENA